MATVTGSTKAGPCTITGNVDTSVPSILVTLYWTTPKTKLGTVTLTEDEASASIGGKYLGTTCKGTVTANFDTQTLTYTLKVSSKSYSGTVMTW